MGGLYDSVCINMRRRNYEIVISNSLQLLNNYSDSIKSVNIIPLLYQSNLRLDSAGNRMANLKSFLETLILDNANNEPLTQTAFYYIQKCKVSLEQYQSAMTGFQQIVNQNPYSYEGLVASWDYAATSLLDSTGGSGGGISNYQLSIPPGGDKLFNEELNEYGDDPNEKYDRKVFTKEDRKTLRKNVLNSFEISREKETERIKLLEKKFIEGDADENEKSELMTKRTLNEVIKVNNPKDIYEHINIVNDNIQKVFGSTNGNNVKDISNIIPTQYRLAQNYPNPFNPITKINFDLPEAGRVKLIIYDMLGREITRLVNDELKTAGKYTMEFNGVNLASGVYFYRLEANKFVQTKRMVLIK